MLSEIGLLASFASKNYSALRSLIVRGAPLTETECMVLEGEHRGAVRPSRAPASTSPMLLSNRPSPMFQWLGRMPWSANVQG